MVGRPSEQRHRSSPVVLMDASDGGKRLREVMEKHHMRATSAEQGGSTWFGHGERPRSSMMWRSLFDALAHSDVWHLRCSSSTRAS